MKINNRKNDNLKKQRFFYIISFRFSIISLFIVLFFLSSIIINKFFVHQQKTTSSAFANIQFDESLSKLEFRTLEDSLQAHQLIDRFRQSLAAVKMNMNETQIYSSLFLMLILIISLLVFMLLFNLILKPFNELISATRLIQHGNFDVSLDETGFKEIKNLKQSFNQMSVELAKTQKKLIESEKLIIWKEISRMLAHEIKNPLTPINLSIQRLEEKYVNDQDDLIKCFPEAAETIHQEIRNLQNLARSFSDFAKINEPEYLEFDPEKSISEIIKPYEYSFKIKLHSDKQRTIKFDTTHFYQIITNLIQNAIDASENDSEINISISDRDDIVEIKIRDHGSGISKENLQKIFEPYYSSKIKGTGLGLAVVKRLININFAEIEVESELDKGTTFFIKCDKNL